MLTHLYTSGDPVYAVTATPRRKRHRQPRPVQAAQPRSSERLLSPSSVHVPAPQMVTTPLRSSGRAGCAGAVPRRSAFEYSLSSRCRVWGDVFSTRRNHENLKSTMIKCSFWSSLSG